MLTSMNQRWVSSLALLVLAVAGAHAATKPMDFTAPSRQNARALSLAHTFERYDLDESAVEERRYTQNADPMLKTPHGVPKRQAYKSNLFATNTSMIAVEFICQPPPWAVEPAAKTCAKVRKAFQGVFQHVEDAFDLKRPIKVKFEYSSFCAAQIAGNHLEQQPANAKEANFRFPGTSGDNKKQPAVKPAECAETSSLLGYAAPMAFWIPDTPDPVTGIRTTYPQALVKQLLADSRNNIKFNEFDIYARFNADRDDGLWFKDDLPKTPIKSWQYDFQYIVLHEFVSLSTVFSNKERCSKSLKNKKIV